MGFVNEPEVTVQPVGGSIDQFAVIKLTQFPLLLKFALVDTLVKVNGAFEQPSRPGETANDAVGALLVCIGSMVAAEKPQGFSAMMLTKYELAKPLMLVLPHEDSSNT